MLEEILNKINKLKQELKYIQNSIKELENSLEEAPAIVDLEGQLDLLADDRLLELYDIEDELFYQIKNLYTIIYQYSYLEADIMGDAIAKLLTKKVGKGYTHITPIHQTNTKKVHQIRIIVPKDNKTIKFKGTNPLPKDTIVLDSNINGFHLDKNINFISSFKHENISTDLDEEIYLNLNVPINGKFKDNYMSIPSLSIDNYHIIKEFIDSVIEYKLEGKKEELSMDEIEILLDKQINSQKKLTLTKD